MAYIEIDTASGVLGFDVKENNAVLTSSRGRDVSISVPEYVSFGEKEIKVNKIGRKAFLSNKNLRELILPDSICEIEDWAFAMCSNLERITVKRDILLGNGVFKDCFNLKQVIINETANKTSPEDTGNSLLNDNIELNNSSINPQTKKNIDVSFMLAAVIYLLDDKYLFDLLNAGSDDWLENWDNKMDVILNTPDDEGFIALLACGEEDYEGRDNTLDGYLSASRRRKVKICMLRLLHNYNLLPERESRLKEYLYNHRAGRTYSISAFDNGNGYSDGYSGRTSINRNKDPYDINLVEKVNPQSDDIKPMDETWKVVLEEHGDEEEYYQLLLDCKCVDENNLTSMLEDMNDKHARMKAFLLRENSTKKVSNFFDSMNL